MSKELLEEIASTMQPQTNRDVQGVSAEPATVELQHRPGHGEDRAELRIRRQQMIRPNASADKADGTWAPRGFQRVEGTTTGQSPR